MQTTIKKTSVVKPKSDTPRNDDKTKTPQEEKLKKAQDAIKREESKTKLLDSARKSNKTPQEEKLKKAQDAIKKEESKTKLLDSARKSNSKVKTTQDSAKKENSKSKTQEDRLKLTNNISTPRNYIPKASTADIYGQKKNVTQSTKAPRKSNTSYLSNVSPMKDILRASPSTASIKSTLSTNRGKTKLTQNRDLKVSTSLTQYKDTPKREFNVTVNSPIVKRKLNLDREKSFVKEDNRNKNRNISSVESKSAIDKKTSRNDVKKQNSIVNERQRGKTITLDETEVKVLTEGLDNNAEMLNLTKKLTAKPKAFYIDLDDKAKEVDSKSPNNSEPKLSEDEVSYEDDFESYESDFDSYHSSSCNDDDGDDRDDDADDGNDDIKKVDTHKEVRDEENMLDSGNFDLRDRSANKTKPNLDFILETTEGQDKPSSLTDEGFQEMSSASVSTDVGDRSSLFIDLTRSKENKRKKRINARLQQRAKDLLSIITLHEMSYSLFEMKPISYDLYMATFGRNNYTQVAVQTFDDGNTVDVQTEVVDTDSKWTQHPVEFTKNDICFDKDSDLRKNSVNTENYLTKFAFLTQFETKVQENNNANLNDSYKRNPLRIYFEQRDGVGSNTMLPYEKYKNLLNNNEYNPQRLSKFLKKAENRIISILQSNTGNTELSEIKASKFPFSKGFLLISPKNITEPKLSFLNNSKILNVFFSQTKFNLIMTAHDKVTSVSKYLVCLWDIGVTRREPLKILAAIDNIAIGKLRGATDGIFVAALEDCSLHLWDLTEEPTWRSNVACEEITTKPVEIDKTTQTQMEVDREWNLKINLMHQNANSVQYPLQICSYTSSAYNLTNFEQTDKIVGLEFIGEASSSQESGRKIVGQVMSLLRTGILTIWKIIQEKSKSNDIGKAYWSKMKLEKSQTISLINHINIPNDIQNSSILDSKVGFNLNAAKRRLTSRKQEKHVLKKQISRAKSAVSFDSDRPTSAASVKNKAVFPEEKLGSFGSSWENGVVCNDLKVMYWKNGEYYLVGKNCGEVLCCRRILGVVKVTSFCIAIDTSSVTCIEVSPHKLPYFLAATDSGTISVCSLNDHRVLITLDCSNMPIEELDKCQSDHKGRFVSNITARAHIDNDAKRSKPVSSVAWSRINPCCIYTTLIDGTTVGWELTYSDIYAKFAAENSALRCVAVESSLALITANGEVQIHKLTNEHKTEEYKNIFEKYVALL